MMRFTPNHRPELTIERGEEETSPSAAPQRVREIFNEIRSAKTSEDNTPRKRKLSRDSIIDSLTRRAAAAIDNDEQFLELMSALTDICDRDELVAVKNHIRSL